MFERIAIIKTGWCETYDGDLVGGAHANIVNFEEGHERYNFRPGPDEKYYAYTPPIGETGAAPSPRESSNWLVFVVAKKPKQAGIVLVGWYEGATFTGGYHKRPEYDVSPPTLERDIHKGQFSYTLIADSATLIPAPARTFSFKGDRTKRSPVYYLLGNGEKGDWRNKLATDLLAEKQRYEETAAAIRATTPFEAGNGICGDQERRKQVEDAAVAHVMAHFGDAYHFQDRQKDKCGFDLLFIHKESQREHHVEVKGTALKEPHFFISKNELAYAAQSNDWQLAMVTDALEQPNLTMMPYDKVKEIFDLQAVTWHATLRKK